MGSPPEFREHSECSDNYSDEFPQHEVEITRPFYLSVYTITEAEYLQVAGTSPRDDDRPHNHPVAEVSWEDVTAFCKTLSELPEEKAAGRVYRIPTEAEWEHACRAGTTTAFHWGDTASSHQANIDGTQPHGRAKKGIHLNLPVAVGSYPPNGFGLYDMHGNIGVWTADRYSADYYERSPRKDPCNKRRGSDHSLRGGSYLNQPIICRAARRYYGPPAMSWPVVGMRLACTLAPRRRSRSSSPKTQ
jgi:formylglycine-generating enzyme required for sulfatase activity